MRPARSGWVALTPLSITAMMTRDSPVVVSQAKGAWIFARCHWLPKEGSSGVAMAWAIASGST